MNASLFKKRFDKIADNVNSVIHGKDDVVRLALVAACANGHVLFEDVPGVGKSMLARALGISMGCGTNRIQCTPDMLPGDITGSSVIDQSGGRMKFVFKPGPVFTNILLVDEINRSTPKTQSALLEAMAERNVTAEGVTHPLPAPFLCLATQNPIENAGTFPLPEAQLDRFLFKLSIGYPDLEAERLVARGNALTLEVDNLGPVCNAEEIVEMQRMASEVTISTAVETYILEIVQATRQDKALLMAASPRATIALFKASKALAAADGRSTVYPEDVKALLNPVLAHRTLLSPEALLRGDSVSDVLERTAGRIKPPMVSAVDVPEAPARRRTRKAS
ncbi:MAG TPA: MoxR family ATPase [Mycobacteriales bacterium]|nr:MoxR family ATPase [Mycobacteriales bacterium]